MFTKENLKSLLLVVTGTLIFSIAVNMIAVPNHFGEGGVTGLTLLLYYVFKIEPALTNLIINGFLLVIGWKFLERRTLYFTFIALFVMTLTLKYIHPTPFVPENILVAAALGGVMAGAGLGMVILGGGSTAGSDIVALLAKKYLGMNVAITLLLIDLMIMVPMTFVIGIEKAVVTVVLLFVATKVITYCLEGFNPRQSVTIISEHHDEIAKQITEQLDRGVTVLNGYGYYSKERKEVLYTVVNRMQLLPVQRIIQQVDPNAFVIIANVHQVLGEGFTFELEDAPQK